MLAKAEADKGEEEKEEDKIDTWTRDLFQDTCTTHRVMEMVAAVGYHYNPSDALACLKLAVARYYDKTEPVLVLDKDKEHHLVVPPPLYQNKAALVQAIDDLLEKDADPEFKVWNKVQELAKALGEGNGTWGPTWVKELGKSIYGKEKGATVFHAPRMLLHNCLRFVHRNGFAYGLYELNTVLDALFLEWGYTKARKALEDVADFLELQLSESSTFACARYKLDWLHCGGRIGNTGFRERMTYY